MLVTGLIIPHICLMLQFSPILLALVYGVIMYRFSVWRTNRELTGQSHELLDPKLKVLTDRMAKALEVSKIRVHLYEIDPVNGLAAPDGKIYITRGFIASSPMGRSLPKKWPAWWPMNWGMWLLVIHAAA